VNYQIFNHVVMGVVQLPHGEGLPLPAYETAGAAGMDLRAALPYGYNITLRPGDRVLIPTGISIAVPAGCEVQIRPRSGLAYKSGISVVNTPGTVDSDYRGEIKVILINHGQEDFVIKRGDRIAQMVLCPIHAVVWHVVDQLSETERGAGGYGSTGV
jgi:dUTP pyrophosphatase